MSDILHYLPVLLVSIGMNILLGLYYKIGINRLSFDLKILLNGVIKAGIIGIVFIGMAFCFDRVDLSSLGVNPCIFMHSAIFLYMGKAMSNLAKILGVQEPSQNEESPGSVLADAADAAASALTEPISAALDTSDTDSKLSTADGMDSAAATGDPALPAKESASSADKTPALP